MGSEGGLLGFWTGMTLATFQEVGKWLNWRAELKRWARYFNAEVGRCLSIGAVMLLVPGAVRGFRAVI